MPTVTRSRSLCLDPSHTDCRHSREAFHALFRVVAIRRDVSPIAKLIHQALVSMHRTGKAWTQTQIGAEVGLSRYQTWKGLAELIAAKWVTTKRRGLGLTNTYELLVIDAADLDGRAKRGDGFRPARHQDAGQPGTASRRESRPKNSGKNIDRAGVPETYQMTRQTGMQIVDGRLRYVGPGPR